MDQNQTPAAEPHFLDAASCMQGASGVRYGFSDLPNGRMRIRSITDVDRIEFDLAELDDEGEVDMQQLGLRRARTVVLCAVDGEGKQLFKPEDVDRIARWDQKVLKKAYVDCSVHADINERDVERFAKNSGRVPDSVSP